MDRDAIIARLRENEAALRARGVAHAALFGSRVRRESRPNSDTDITIEIDPAAHVTLFDHVGLKDYIVGLFDGPVDVVNRDGLLGKPRRSCSSSGRLMNDMDVIVREVASIMLPRWQIGGNGKNRAEVDKTTPRRFEVSCVRWCSDLDSTGEH
jgi:predicted nucleotidyltransferase